MTATPRISAIVRQIQAEYSESAGLRLSPAQIQRLWRLEANECLTTLQTLVNLGILRCARDGTYVRSG